MKGTTYMKVESAEFLTLFVLILFNEENEEEDGLFGGGEALVRRMRIMKIFLQGGKLAVSLTLMFLIKENEDEDGLFGGGGGLGEENENNENILSGGEVCGFPHSHVPH
jgi:hypothetical protein